MSLVAFWILLLLVFGSCWGCMVDFVVLLSCGVLNGVALCCYLCTGVASCFDCCLRCGLCCLLWVLFTVRFWLPD